MDPVDGKAKQHNANAGLDEHVGNNVERLAKPPKLQVVSSFVFNMWQANQTYITYLKPLW